MKIIESQFGLKLKPEMSGDLFEHVLHLVYLVRELTVLFQFGIEALEALIGRRILW